VKPVSWLVLATHVPAGGALGGVVRYTTELVAALARREDVDLELLTTAAAAPALRDATGGAARVRVLRAAPGPVLPLLERYARTARPHPQVVHGVKHLVPRSGGALKVLTVHDMVLLDRPQDFGRAKRHLLPPPYRASIRQADLLLPVSVATERRLAAYEPGAAQRSTVVPLATTASLLQAPAAPVPSLAGRRFALVVGDSGRRKNLGTVVDAWPTVRRRVPDAVLAIAGPPDWGRAELGRAYAELVREGAIVPLGRIDDAQLRWAYEHSAVVLCPSLAEGFGLPVAEALDLGASVVISDDAALQEVAAGRARAVVPALDAAGWAAEIVTVLLSPHRAAVPDGHVRTWDDVAADTTSAVLRCLAEQGRSGRAR